MAAALRAERFCKEESSEEVLCVQQDIAQSHPSWVAATSAVLQNRRGVPCLMPISGGGGLGAAPEKNTAGQEGCPSWASFSPRRGCSFSRRPWRNLLFQTPFFSLSLARSLSSCSCSHVRPSVARSRENRGCRLSSSAFFPTRFPLVLRNGFNKRIIRGKAQALCGFVFQCWLPSHLQCNGQIVNQ